MDTRRAIVGLTLTYITWSLFSVWSSSAKYGPAAVTLEAFFLFIILIGYCKIKGINLSWKEARQSFLYSVARVLSLGLMFYSFLYIDVGIFNTIGALSVFMMAGFFAPLAGERFKKSIIVPLIVSILGVAFVSGTVGPSGWSDINSKYFFAFAAMIAATFSIVLWRKCVQNMPATHHLTYMHGWTTLLSFPLVLILIASHSISSDITPSTFQITMLTIAAIAGTIGDFTYSFAQRHSTLTINGLFTSSGALFSCLFGWIFLGQALTMTQLFGMILIAGSVAAANYVLSKTPQSEESLVESFIEDMPRAYELAPGVELDVA